MLWCRLSFWLLFKAYLQTRTDKKALEKRVKEQQNDLQIAAMPCYRWLDLLDRM